MTRTDVMASSRPRQTAATTERRGPGIWRIFALVSVLALMATALVAPVSALAATETTSTEGYNQEPNKPKEKEKEPTSGTSPSKEKSEPAQETAPAKETTTTPTAEPEASTLPFTGFDLRWSLAVGLLLVAGGVSIVAVQRRQRSRQGR